jgi:hypothetical protein
MLAACRTALASGDATAERSLVCGSGTPLLPARHWSLPDVAGKMVLPVLGRGPALRRGHANLGVT